MSYKKLLYVIIKCQKAKIKTNWNVEKTKKVKNSRLEKIMSGLASLTANYTDSEDEDQNKDSEDENTQDSVTFPTSGPPSHLTHSASGTPNSSKSVTPSNLKSKGPPNLVSDYGDIQDDNDDKDVASVPMDLESDDESKEHSSSEAKEVLNR